MSRTLIASDDFNRANGDVGANWGYLRDTAWQGSPPAVTSNALTARASGTHYQVIRWIGAGTVTDDQYAKITIGSLGFFGPDYRQGVIVRCSADTDTNADFYGYYVQDDSSGSRTTILFKNVNGTETTLDSASVAWANGDTIEMECEGTTIRGFQNGVQMVSVTDSALSTGKFGILIAGNSGGPPSMDNWEGGNITSGGGGGGSGSGRLIGGKLIGGNLITRLS